MHPTRDGCGGRPRLTARRRAQGLTLPELLVTISVLILAVSWAVPGYQRFIAHNEVTTEVMRLKIALAMARNSAVTRRTTVTLCPSRDRLACTNDDWTAPLLLVEGRAEGGVIDGEVLKVWEDSRALSVTYRADNRPVRYSATGRATGHNGTFAVCGRRDESATVVVSNFGRVRVGSDESPPAC